MNIGGSLIDDRLLEYLRDMSKQQSQQWVAQAIKRPHLCPKCDGEGVVYGPHGSGATPTRTCPVCNGEKVLWRPRSVRGPSTKRIRHLPETDFGNIP